MRYFAIPRLTSTGPGKLSMWSGELGFAMLLLLRLENELIGNRNSVIGVDAKKEASIEGLSEHGHELDNGPR
ncbi:hypothetical protein CPAR01_10403 [Colletotrichum paranaense]|uniref:Uncharacterized protein n=1 Tax=Colletotrichum paranaense TaxID=1914294 RepID=A0ABQ9SDX2_9PEZI|nr:uncharacterized protein CPAR01_10403 [Colletotrichum paranaense]KAK1533695.1 hypothetical protein CPAR01_10403 [Colletotrichum paranaense]